MAKPKHIDLTAGGVITQEALVAYADGRLSDAERSEMDRLLRDDPFARDALEGLQRSAHTGEISTVITSINTKLREKTGVRERKKKGIQIHWANYAYAALILAVLIALAFVLIHYFSNRDKAVMIDTPAVKAQEALPPVAEPNKKDSDQIDTTATVAMPVKDTSSAKIQPLPAADKKPPVPPADTAKKSVAHPANGSVSGKLTADQTISMLGAAKTYFEAGDYVNAEKKYNEILASQPDNADALYFGGVSGYLNGSKGLGEANFDKLSGTGLYVEGTKWYKANILIKKGRKEEAKPLLRDLINSNSYFKDRAVKQYEELYSK